MVTIFLIFGKYGIAIVLYDLNLVSLFQHPLKTDNDSLVLNVQWKVNTYQKVKLE